MSAIHRSSAVADILSQKFNLIDLRNHFGVCVRRALDERFPNGIQSTWSINDKNGVVHGWPEEIRLQVVRFSNVPYLCVPLVECKRGHLSFVKRLLAFYQTNMKDRTAKASIIAMLVSESDEILAKEMGFEMIVFTRPSAPPNLGAGPPLTAPPPPPVEETPNIAADLSVEEEELPDSFADWFSLFRAAKLPEEVAAELTEIFDENALEIDQLEEMTRDHLKELGVKLGYQMKIMKIRDRLFGSRPNTAPTSVVRTTTPSATKPSGSVSSSNSPSPRNAPTNPSLAPFVGHSPMRSATDPSPAKPSSMPAKMPVTRSLPQGSPIGASAAMPTSVPASATASEPPRMYAPMSSHSPAHSPAHSPSPSNSHRVPEQGSPGAPKAMPVFRPAVPTALKQQVFPKYT